jgi:hypothetical protein
MVGTVLSFDAATWHHAIKVDSTGDCVKLMKNLKPSLLVANLGA